MTELDGMTKLDILSMSLKLVDGKDPILKKPGEKFDFNNPPCDPWDLAEALVKCMIDENGLGLSACQVGLPYTVFAVVGQPNYVMFNPRIVDVSQELVELEEGCLSFPGVIAKIKRPRHVKVRFTGPDGQTTTMKFTGMTARVILHEMDHMQGKLFLDYLPRFKREQLFKKAVKDKKYGKQAIDPVATLIAPLERAALLSKR